MGIEEMKNMKTQLMSCVQSQLGHLDKVDAKQLGEAVDMIKDLSQAIYYCTITESMEKIDKDKEEKTVNNMNYYTVPYMPKDDPYRNMERGTGYMYYSSPNTNNGSNAMGGNTAYYTDMMRDPREGKSAIRRRMYMEGKEQHKDVTSQLHELEAYLQELSTDITEMIRDASPEEKATLHQKITTLASKIA